MLATKHRKIGSDEDANKNKRFIPTPEELALEYFRAIEALNKLDERNHVEASSLAGR